MDLKQSVQIPGTKIKIPIIEFIAAGAAVIAAIVLLRGKSGQSPDVSTVANDTSTDTSAQDLTSAYTGALEDMSSRIADLEAAQNATSSIGGSPSGSGGDNSLGNGTGAPPVSDIPIADVTATTDIIGESINPRSIVTPTGPGTATISTPPLVSTPPSKSGVSPIAPPKPASTASKVEPAEGQKAAAKGPAKTTPATKPKSPVTKVEPATGQSAAQDWLAKTTPATGQSAAADWFSRTGGKKR